MIIPRGAKVGGVGGVATPPEFWKGGLNPPDFWKNLRRNYKN